MDELFQFEQQNSFKSLITDRLSDWQKEQVSVLHYGALYCWILTFIMLISQQQTEFPLFLPVSIVLFAMSLLKMRQFQAEIFLKKYPKFYLNKNQWNHVLFNRFRYNRLLGYLKKRGWNDEQLQIIRSEVKERIAKIMAQSLLKKAIWTLIMESVIAQVITNLFLPTASQVGVTKIAFTLTIWGGLFLVFYILLAHLEMFRIQISDLSVLQELHKKLLDFLLRKKLK